MVHSANIRASRFNAYINNFEQEVLHMPRSSRPKTINIQDVARHSGVSIATVSRVLSNADYAVAKETRDRVLAAAKELHYIPNAIGRSLQKSTSHIIGVVLPNITNPYYAQLLQAIEDEALKTDWRIIFCSAHRNIELEKRSINMLLQERVAGILLSSIDKQAAAASKAIETGVNLVTLEQQLPVECSHIGFDYAEGVKIAIQHLIDQGNTRIAYVGAPIDRYSRREMLRGYKETLMENRLPLNESYIWYGIDEKDTSELYELENGRTCAYSLTSLDPPPTAYVCINDLTALGLIRGLQDKGFRIPEQLSVIGFDDIPLGSVNLPPLTTISQNTFQMGSIAFKQLIDQIKNPEKAAASIVLHPTLIIRGTTRV